jgi:hypothetical protein
MGFWLKVALFLNSKVYDISMIILIVFYTALYLL